MGATVAWKSFNRLCVAQIKAHSPRTLSRPRSKPALFTFPGEIGVDAPSNSA